MEVAVCGGEPHRTRKTEEVTAAPTQGRGAFRNNFTLVNTQAMSEHMQICSRIGGETEIDHPHKPKN